MKEKSSKHYKQSLYFVIILLSIFMLIAFLSLYQVQRMGNEIENQKEINALQCELINQQVELIGGFVAYSNELVVALNQITDYNLSQIYNDLKEVEC